MHDFAEQNKINIAINEMNAGRARGLIHQGSLDAGLVAAPGRFQIEIRPKSREVRHQVTDGDVAVPALKFGEVFGYGIVQPDLALFEKPHDGGGGSEYLGERCGVEDGVERHWLTVRDECPAAISFLIHHLPV